MLLKAFLVLVFFATIAQASEVCLCCDDQIIKQNLTECADIARPATDEEQRFLLDYCLTKSLASYNKFSDYKIAFFLDPITNTVSSFQFPKEEHCHTMFNSLDGLLYVVPESDSKLFKVLRKTRDCYASILIEEEELQENKYHGTICYSDKASKKAAPFKSFFCCYIPKKNNVNVTRLVYIVRRPTSYRITKVEDFGDAEEELISHRKDDKVTFGKFSMCNPSVENMDFEVTFNHTVHTFMDFKNYTFFPRTYFKLGYYDFSWNKAPITIELQDPNNNTRLLKLDTSFDSIYLETTITYKINEGYSIPPSTCITAEIHGVKRNIDTQFKATIELNFGGQHDLSDRGYIEKLGKRNEYIIEDLTLKNVELSDCNGVIIIIPYEIVFLILGCVIGMIFFALLLLIVIKIMNCVDKKNRCDDEGITPIVQEDRSLADSVKTWAETFEENAEILGDKIVRLGSFISDVTSWIIEEIESKN